MQAEACGCGRRVQHRGTSSAEPADGRTQALVWGVDDHPSDVLDDLNRVAIRVGSPCDQQSTEPFVRRRQGGGTARGEFGKCCSSVVGPEDDGRSLAFWNWIEAMIITGGCDRSDTDLVAIQRQTNVNRLASVGTRNVSVNPRRE